MPSPTHDPTEALARSLAEVDSACGDPECHTHIDECLVHEDGYTRIAVRQAAALSAAGWHLTRAGDETQTAARRLVDASDALARWDEAHGYIINSERDALAGDVSQAWASLRAALDSDR